MSVRRPAIAWLSNETPDLFGGGGARRQYYQIAAVLDAGFDVRVGVLDTGQPRLSIEELAPTAAYGPRRLKGLLDGKGLASLLSPPVEAAVLAHLNTYEAVGNACRARGIPFLVDFHNVLSRDSQALGTGHADYYVSIERAALRSASRATACSAEEVAALKDVSEIADVRLAPHGVAPAEWRLEPQPVSPPLIAFFGSYSHPPNMGAACWLADEVWPAVREVFPQAELHLMGSGSLPPRLQFLPGVKVTGRVPDLPTALAKASAVMAPTVWGPGTRVKFIEGLASGVPVVANRLGAEGYLADGCYMQAEGAAGFIDACLTLLSDRQKAEELGRRGRELALSKYTWSAVSEPIIRWLEEATSRRGS